MLIILSYKAKVLKCLNTTDCRKCLNIIDDVRDEICFKKIVSNIELDQFCIIHASSLLEIYIRHISPM